jgi:hypothetical protein
MADINVASFIRQLRQYLPHVPPISGSKLKALHKVRDYEGMVRLIRTAMNLDIRLLVGWVNASGPKEAPAWVEMPSNMPYYGTPEFKQLQIKIFIRKQFLEQSTYKQVAIAIAHELSHVVLHSIHHPLRSEEKAVDLTAMLLGFSHIYMVAAHTTNSKLGYLTSSELRAASRILVPRRFRTTRSLFVAVRSLFVSFPVPAVAGFLVLSMWTTQTISSKFRLHQNLQAEANNLLIPKAVNSYMTLISAQVGMFSLTKTYLITQPARLDLDNRQLKIWDAACTKKRTNIDAGAIYAYEFREASGSLIGKFEVSSCPRQ